MASEGPNRASDRAAEGDPSADSSAEWDPQVNTIASHAGGGGLGGQIADALKQAGTDDLDRTVDGFPSVDVLGALDAALAQSPADDARREDPYWGNFAHSGFPGGGLADDDEDSSSFAISIDSGSSAGSQRVRAGEAGGGSGQFSPLPGARLQSDDGETADDADDADEDEGKPFGPYSIQSELGRGGMGVVYMAYHQELRRHCALKLLQGHGQDAVAAERFVLEGHASARLGKHPNIVQVFDAGVVEGTPYIAMEFVVGTPLDRRLANGPLPVEEALELGRKLALALDHAHNCGIVHRDMKPGNVIIDRHGEPQILDFGLAKDTMNTSSVSAAGTILGTPSYMPPEQAQPGLYPVDRRSDVYSLSATLFHCIAGEVPFRGESAVDTIVKVILEDPPSLSRRYGQDPDVEAILEKALEKDPDRRYRTALAFADDLSRVLTGEEPTVRPRGPLGRLWRRIRRNRTAVLAVSAASVAVLALVGYLLWSTAQRGRAILRRTEASAIVGEMYGNEGAEVRIGIYGRTLEADPTWEHAYFQLAVAYLDRALELDAEGVNDGALAMRTSALETLNRGIDRGLGAPGYFQRANTYEELRRFAPMLDDLKTAHRLDPEGSFGLRAACAAAVYESRYDDAETFGSQALAWAPDDDLTYFRRAEARLRLGRLDAAYKDAVRAAELWEVEPEYHLLAGRIRAAQGDQVGYAKHVLDAAAVNPEHALVLAEVSRDALRRGEPQRALRLAKRAVQTEIERPGVASGERGRDPQAFVARARARLAAGERARAEADLAAASVELGAEEEVRSLRELIRLAAPKAADLPATAALAARALSEGAYPLAKHAAEQVLAFEPVHPIGLRVRAAIARAEADDRAFAATLAGREEAHACGFRAAALARSGASSATIDAAVERALAESAQPPEALVVRAAQRVARGEAELALLDLDRALRADPLDLDAAALRANALGAVHDASGAAAAAARAQWLSRQPKAAPPTTEDPTPDAPGE